MLKSADKGMLGDKQYIPIRKENPKILIDTIKLIGRAVGLKEQDIEKYRNSRVQVMNVYKVRQAIAPIYENFGYSHGH